MNIQPKLAVSCRRLVSLFIAMLCILTATQATAQSTILSDGFEFAFPGVWTTSDTNAADGTYTWRDVNSTFGAATYVPRAPRPSSRLRRLASS